jgi:hypothetical protein
MTRVFGRAQNKGGMNEKQPDLASFAGVLSTQEGAWVGARVRVFPILYEVMFVRPKPPVGQML